MKKSKKIILSIVWSLIGIILLTIALFYTLTPGIPAEKVQEDGTVIDYLSLPNGDYTGESVLGFLDGMGTFSFDSGEVYEGEWKNHEMSGNGKLTSSAGVYEGDYAASVRSGSGTFTWSDGSKYVGQWKNDKLNGEGELTTPSGLFYNGTFNEDAFVEGQVSGKYNGNQVKFVVEDGVLSNKISVTFADGVTYTGEFLGKYFSGDGEMTFPGVGKYVGEFVSDKRSGFGVFTWTDSAKYDGKWSNDVFNGYGTYTFDSSTSITGTFKDGGLNGTYTYKNSDGEFTTVWSNGKCTSITAK